MSIDAVISAYFQANDRRVIGINPPSGSNIPCNLILTTAFGGTLAAGSTTQGGFADILLQTNGPRTFSGSTDTLDLYGVLADSYGSLVNAMRIKAIGFSNLSTSSAITIGGGTDAVSTLLNSTGTLTLPPGAWFVCATPDPIGWTLVPTVSDTFTITGVSGQQYEAAFLMCME